MTLDLKYEVSHPHANPFYRKFLILTRKDLDHYDVDAILKVLRVLLEIFPNYEELSYNLVATFDLKKDYKSALPHVNKLIELSPDNPNYYFKRSDYEIKLGEIDKALDDIEKAVNLDKRYKEFGMGEASFDVLKNNERFKSIIEN